MTDAIPGRLHDSLLTEFRAAAANICTNDLTEEELAEVLVVLLRARRRLDQPAATPELRVVGKPRARRAKAESTRSSRKPQVRGVQSPSLAPPSA